MVDPTLLLKALVFPTQTLYEALNIRIKDFSEDTEQSKLSVLEEESVKEDIRARVLQNQAKAAQEMAIARRIEDAEEVEIEEYYDISGEGHVGAKASSEGVNLGASAEGRKITKRVIKFKGSKTIQQIYDADK